MRSLTLVTLIFLLASSAFGSLYRLEGYPNCKCVCSKLPPVKETVCSLLCGGGSIIASLKPRLPTIKTCCRRHRQQCQPQRYPQCPNRQPQYICSNENVQWWQ